MFERIVIRLMRLCPALTLAEAWRQPWDLVVDMLEAAGGGRETGDAAEPAMRLKDGRRMPVWAAAMRRILRGG